MHKQVFYKQFVWLWLFFVFPLQAQEVLLLEATEERYALEGACWYFVDEQRDRGFAEVRQAEFWTNFLPVQDRQLNFGFTSDVIWVSFRLQSSTDLPWLLYIKTALLEDITLYAQQPDGSWQERKFGNRYPFSSWDTDHVWPTVYLDLPSGQERRFFMRFQNKSPMVLPLFLEQTESYASATRYHDLFYGLYFGGLLVMMLFNLFIFYTLRERSYIYYIGSILATLLLSSFISGFAFKVFLAQFPIINAYGARALAGMVVIFTGLFAQSFLETQRYAPLMHRLLWINMGLAVVGIALGLSDVWPGATTKVVSVQAVLLLVSGIWVWRKGNPYARFFVLAWAIYIFGGLAYTTYVSGLLPTSFWTKHGAEIGAISEVILLALALSDRYRLMRQERERVIAQSLALQENSAKLLEQKVRERTQALSNMNQELNQLNEELNAAFDTVNFQKADIERKTQSLKASINYARRIQEAMLPTSEQIRRAFADHFVFFRPRDGVSGDFYFFTQHGGHAFFAVADCTGHGVPGAFMSMIGNDLLHQLIRSGIDDPAQILHGLHAGVQQALRQSESKNQDGMTIALCRYNPQTQQLAFADAKQPLFIVGAEPQLIKGSRYEIGGQAERRTPHYITHQLTVEPGMMLFLYSDGYPDQIGGKEDRKFRSKPFREYLHQIAHLPTAEQAKHLDQTLTSWMGEQRQIDDILVWGIKF
ncbi:MAG: 7TM diverse intracellular signaling domain-containing protein [Bernardetiaceae bacterium]